MFHLSFAQGSELTLFWLIFVSCLYQGLGISYNWTSYQYKLEPCSNSLKNYYFTQFPMRKRSMKNCSWSLLSEINRLICRDLRNNLSSAYARFFHSNNFRIHRLIQVLTGPSIMSVTFDHESVWFGSKSTIILQKRPNILSKNLQSEPVLVWPCLW